MRESVLLRWYKKEITFYTDELLEKEYERVSKMKQTHLSTECLKAIKREMKKRSK